MTTDVNPAPAAERRIARMTVAADRDYVPPVLDFVRDIGLRLGLGAPEADALCNAVTAVSLNVIERGFGTDSDGSFDVSIARRPGQVMVAVEDQGLPYDFAALAAGPGESAADAPAPAAWLTHLADGVRFSNLGTQGNRVEITKRVPARAIDDYIAAGHAAPVAPPDAGPSQAPVTLRLMTPADVVGVARCTYSVYGYTLPDAYLYFPDRMREMLAGGLLEVVVGATPDGEIVSVLTCEVERAAGLVGYLGEGLVDPRFRHHGLLDQMIRMAIQRARDRGLLAVYGEAVTVHPYSQKSNIALGFAETGVQLGDESPAVDFKQIPGAGSPKRTATVLFYKKTNEGPRREIYLPPRHRPIVERIYARSAFARDLREPPNVWTPAARAELHVDVFPHWNEAAIRVVSYGADLPQLVRARLRELCLRRIDWICVDLPLGDPGAAVSCEALEGLGFFFAGVLPDLAGTDVLRLQYLNEVEPEVESVHFASDFGRELFDYAVREMQRTGAGPADARSTT